MTLEVSNAPHRRTRSAWIAGGLTILIAAVAVALMPGRGYAIATMVPLGTAQTYAVLGGQSVTNTGPSVLTGDLGVSPGGPAQISGFPPGLVLGAVHAGDAQALQAQSDLTVGYNQAAGQAQDASIAGDLGGDTLLPGVYNASSSIGLTGTLTLDAEGDPNAVWVFQIGSTLTTASASEVLLVNGASPCNVFWQIGSSATLGTNSTFVGTIMALTSITVTTGATIAGRALARNGSVTLDDNVISRGNCATGGTIGGVIGGITGGTTGGTIAGPTTGGVITGGTIAGPTTGGTIAGPTTGGTIGGPTTGGTIGGPTTGGTIGGPTTGGTIGGPITGGTTGGPGGGHGGSHGGGHGGNSGGDNGGGYGYDDDKPAKP